MVYLLEKISKEDEASILSDAKSDTVVETQLKWRGKGYFNVNTGLSWAVDREKSSYLFLAPKLEARSMDRDFLFFYEDRFYRLRLFYSDGWKVRPVDSVSKALAPSVREAVLDAFSVHRFMGRGEGEEPNLNIEFVGN